MFEKNVLIADIMAPHQLTYCDIKKKRQAEHYGTLLSTIFKMVQRFMGGTGLEL